MTTTGAAPPTSTASASSSSGQRRPEPPAVQAGDVHLTERLGPTFVQRIDSKRIKGLHYMPIGAAGLRILTFNTKSAPVSDPRVRRAIALSLDKVAILNEATFGLGVPVLTWGQPDTDWETSLDFKWKRNVAEAKRLLKEAGYSGQPITLGATRGQGDPWTEPIMRQAAEAGIKFSLQNLGGAELIKKTITVSFTYPSTGPAVWASRWWPTCSTSLHRGQVRRQQRHQLLHSRAGKARDPVPGRAGPGQAPGHLEEICTELLH